MSRQAIVAAPPCAGLRGSRCTRTGGRPAWWHRHPGRYAGVGYSNPAVHLKLHLQRQPGSVCGQQHNGDTGHRQLHRPAGEHEL